MGSDSGLRESIAHEIALAGATDSAAGGVWGSCARDELSPTSDIDVLYWKAGPGGDTAVARLRSRLSELSDYPVDILRPSVETSIEQFALLSAINYHSVFFLQLIGGDAQRVRELENARARLMRLMEVRAREAINVLASAHAASASVIPGERLYSKFVPGGTNAWARIATAAQLRRPGLRTLSTGAVLTRLARRYGIAQQPVADDWRRAMRLRESGGFTGNEIAGTTNAKLDDSRRRTLLAHLLADVSPWIQASTGVPATLLARFAARLTGRAVRVTSAGEKRDSSSLAMLQAFLSADSRELDRFARDHPDDWWVATTVAANSASAADTLAWLMDVSCATHGDLWKTVRLYVARNRNTSRAMLERMLKLPDVRAQERDAAGANLRVRSGEV